MTRRNIVRPIFICVRFQLTRDGGLGLDALFMVQNDPLDTTCTGLRYARGETVNDLFLQDLRITAVARPGAGEAKLVVLEPYSYRRRIHPHHWTAKAMARTLLAIETGLRGLREQEGWVDDTFTYVFRVARIMAAKVVTIVGDRAGVDRASYLEMTPNSLHDMFLRLYAGFVANGYEQGDPDGQSR